MRNIIILSYLCSFSYIGQAQEMSSYNNNTINSTRNDGRSLSTYDIVHEMLKNTHPTLAYQSNISRHQFKLWQKKVHNAMLKLMNFPHINNQPHPICVKQEKRDGYTLEKWEYYPLPKCVSTFLVLKPDKLKHRLPGILCIPGSGRTKEGLAGEPGINKAFTENYKDPHITMALDMVKEGYVAVAVDNAGAGESSDPMGLKNGSNYDYNIISRFLLELGWSWLGYTSYLNLHVLNWMKLQNYINKDRIIVSGFSLGTEPMMVLGVLDKSVYGFIYNDFLCQTQERAVVVTKPDSNGRRQFPNSIRHLIPTYWKYFNFPDVVASLAPRPIIFTEGGLDRDLQLIQSAYQKTGYPDNIEIHHYPKYADPSQRINIDSLPEGLDSKTYLNLVNVDPSSHYFKYELVVPWLKKVLQQ